MTLSRCNWVTQDPDYLRYHDDEWGIPVRERQKLFEMLCLEGQQAGLSWLTVLKKRGAYRHYFYHFNPEKVANIPETTLDRYQCEVGLIRNHLKLASIVSNARALLRMEANGEIFTEFIWSFVNNEPKITFQHDSRQAPTTSSEAYALSTALKRRGFRFIGPTICYAYMQACGLIIDHQLNCFRHPQFSLNPDVDI